MLSIICSSSEKNKLWSFPNSILVLNPHYEVIVGYKAPMS